MQLHDVNAIREHLAATEWLDSVPEDISFLAAGEYNENWLVHAGGRQYVYRINHDSQLGLGGRQIAYEYAVLRALQGSGVTPRPLALDADAPGLGRGVLLMEFLPGGPLDYRRDAFCAADVFARVHACPVPDELVVQADPVRDIAAESLGLLGRFPDHPLPEVGARLLRYHDEILMLAERERGLFDDEPLVVVNTEVNSGNFLVEEGGEACRLVDWEKAVVSCRYQDLGHFLVPTTTLWKTDYRFDAAAREVFLRRYRESAGLSMPLESILRKTSILERTILLRALSWCYMAYYEYTSQGRALRNEDTFRTMRRYLDEVECFLQ